MIDDALQAFEAWWMTDEIIEGIDDDPEVRKTLTRGTAKLIFTAGYRAHQEQMTKLLDWKEISRLSQVWSQTKDTTPPHDQ